MLTLRPNQIEPVRKAVEFFRSKNPQPSLIVLPTAWGKSLLIAHVAKETDDSLLVLQPSKELLEQNIRRYYDLCEDVGMDARIYSASFNSKEIGRITYATIGSIKSLGVRFMEMGFTKIIIDEAHLYPREATSMLGRFLKDSGITHVLGVTATPVKLQQGTDVDGMRMSKLVMLTSRSKKGNFFREMLHIGQVQEMVEAGYWSRLSYEQVQFDGSLLVYNSSRSEYTEESVLEAYEANGGMGRITEALDRHPERRHCLVFCPSVKDAKMLSTMYPNSAYVCGETPPKLRGTIIDAFRSGELRTLFNVRVLTTGFDYTGIDCIILAMSTASVALYYQIIGRATRIDPDKEDALIIDLGGNVAQFGRVEDITYEKVGRTWRMFGTDGKLLTGVPVHTIGQTTRDTLLAGQIEGTPDMPMPFGKYKGQRIKDIDTGYLKWMIRTFEWSERNRTLYKAVTATLNS